MNGHGYPALIKELPEEERPREKLKKFGPESLGTSELLAIILGRGIEGVSALALANRIMNDCADIKGVSRLSYNELLSIKGIGPAKASQVKAAFELARRVKEIKDSQKISLNSPEDVAFFLMDSYSHRERENFGILALDTRHRLKSTKIISVGSMNASLVHPREVFRYAAKEGAAAVILFHNHPSGDASPSDEDIRLTRRLCRAGEIMGINILDHLVIGDGKFTSFKQRGLL